LSQRSSREDAADELREQAASCRRLAGKARTAKGEWALKAAAEKFDGDAKRIDPRSLRR
jgi:stress response protein SCP2